MSEDFEQECSVTRRSNLEQKRTYDRVGAVISLPGSFKLEALDRPPPKAP